MRKFELELIKTYHCRKSGSDMLRYRINQRASIALTSDVFA